MIRSVRPRQASPTIAPHQPPRSSFSSAPAWPTVPSCCPIPWCARRCSTSSPAMTADHCRARLALTALCAALTATLLAACGGSAPAAPPPTPAPSPPASLTTPAAAAPATPQSCTGLPGAQARWLPMTDGGRLEANTAGSGAVAVVFLHEIGRAGMCGFAPYAAWLIQHYPVRVVLVNRCGYGQSDCARPTDIFDIRAETEPAVEWARNNGARTVTLVGASGGGGDAIDAAALVPGVSAVVDL